RPGRAPRLVGAQDSLGRRGSVERLPVQGFADEDRDERGAQETLGACVSDRLQGIHVRGFGVTAPEASALAEQWVVLALAPLARGGRAGRFERSRERTGVQPVELGVPDTVADIDEGAVVP